MDRVEVRGLTFHAKHGCHPEERKTGGPFEVDVIISADLQGAAETDNISDAIDYVEVMRLTKEVMDVPKNLIEHVADNIAQAILKRYNHALQCEVIVKKLQPPVSHQLQYVAVARIVERTLNN